MVEGTGYNGCHELGHEPRDPGLPWRFAQGVGGGGGAHASPPAPSQAFELTSLITQYTEEKKRKRVRLIIRV